jgi:hypothetical protein
MHVKYTKIYYNTLLESNNLINKDYLLNYLLNLIIYKIDKFILFVIIFSIHNLIF